jgi:hypothetical protein
MTTSLVTSCLENTMVYFVSKARVSACMYFLVLYVTVAIFNLKTLSSFSIESEFMYNVALSFLDANRLNIKHFS